MARNNRAIREALHRRKWVFYSFNVQNHRPARLFTLVQLNGGLGVAYFAQVTLRAFHNSLCNTTVRLGLNDALGFRNLNSNLSCLECESRQVIPTALAENKACISTSSLSRCNPRVLATFPSVLILNRRS